MKKRMRWALLLWVAVCLLISSCAAAPTEADPLQNPPYANVYEEMYYDMMGMGYMASRDSTSAAVNWIEQSLNCAGQALLLGGVWMMHKAGLAEKE